MKKIFIILFLASCNTPNSSTNLNNSPLVFSDDLSFNDFNRLLIEYAKTNPYPNIDE